MGAIFRLQGRWTPAKAGGCSVQGGGGCKARDGFAAAVNRHRLAPGRARRNPSMFAAIVGQGGPRQKGEKKLEMAHPRIVDLMKASASIRASRARKELGGRNFRLHRARQQ